ncbi:MAG: hypothetical protein KKE35_03995 [Actinobacteria bacterium]|nr:hypothetical protein [Actinomycetota bacterium]
MIEINNKIDFEINYKEIEKRKERIRKIWQYKQVDHIPIGIYVIDNKERFTRKEIEIEKEKNLRFDFNSIKKSLNLLPDDYIPFLKPEVGCTTIPTILGSKVSYTEQFENYSTVKEPIVYKIEDLEKLNIPQDKNEIIKEGLMPANLEKIYYYKTVAKGLIDMTGIDIGGVLCGSVDIMDSNLFYMSLITEKERILNYLEKLSDLYIKVQEILTGEIGGLNKMMNIDWDTSWYPEGHKGYLSDDPCANFGVSTFETFSKPFNKKIYDRFGYGGFHNCGPHPCASAYLQYDEKDASKKVKAINCSLQFTYKELDKFISVFSGSETILYFLFEEEFYDSKKAIELYKELVDIGIKYNVICIPSYALDTSSHSDDDIRDIYKEFIKISKEYALSLKLK